MPEGCYEIKHVTVTAPELKSMHVFHNMGWRYILDKAEIVYCRYWLWICDHPVWSQVQFIKSCSLLSRRANIGGGCLL